MRRYSKEGLDYVNKNTHMNHGSLSSDIYSYFIFERNEEGKVIGDPSVIVYAIGKTFPDPDYYISRTGTKQCTIEYVTGGVGYVTVNDKTFTVREGDVYVLEPMTKHFYRSDPNDPYSKTWINFDSEIFDQVFNSLKLKGINHFPQVFCEDLFKRLMTIGAMSSFNNVVCDSVLEILLSIAARLSQHQRKKTTKDVPENIFRLKEKLDSSVFDRMTIEDICKSMNVSRSYAIRRFKKCYGVTPYQYLLELKIKHACYMLSSSKTSIKKISDNLGFYDEFHFSATFRKVTGKSPSEYRKSILKSARSE